jgi:hypothetical protein
VLRANLLAHGVADAAFEIEVPTCSAGHRNGKARRVMQDDTACAIGKSYGRDLQARIAAGKDGLSLYFRRSRTVSFANSHQPVSPDI